MYVDHLNSGNLGISHESLITCRQSRCRNGLYRGPNVNRGGLGLWGVGSPLEWGDIMLLVQLYPPCIPLHHEGRRGT